MVGGAGAEVDPWRPLLFELLRPPLGVGLLRIGLAVPAEARIVPEAGRMGELAVDELLETGAASFNSKMMFFKLERATSGSAAGAAASRLVEFLRKPPPALFPPPRPRPPERPPRWLPLRADSVLASGPPIGSTALVLPPLSLLSLRGRFLWRPPPVEAGLSLSLREGVAAWGSLSLFDLVFGLMGSEGVSAEGADIVVGEDEGEADRRKGAEGRERGQREE